MRLRRYVCCFLAALLLMGAVAPEASALTLRRGPEIVEGFTLGNASEMMLAGGGCMVQTDEGLYFTAEADGRIYRTDGETTELIVDAAACRLNYINGCLYYASCREDCFSLWQFDPVSREGSELLCDFPGSLGQFYAVSTGELYFLADETIWKMTPGEEPVYEREAEGLVSFVPTALGMVYAVGQPLCFDIYAEDTPVITGADDYYLMDRADDQILVFSEDGDNYQISLGALFSGDGALQPFTGYGELPMEALFAAEELGEVEEEAYVSVEPQGLGLRAANPIPTETKAVTQGMVNIALRAYQMTDIKWKPVENVRGWKSQFTYTAGTTYVGLPYGQPVGDHYVPWDANYKEFFSVVADRTSEFYTKRSSYTDGLCYATDCSGFVSWAWQTDYRRNTATLADTDVATLVSSTSYANAQIGDILNNITSHVVLITNIRYSSGKISSIEIAHADTSSARNLCCYREWYGSGHAYSLADLQSRFFGQGYKLYRNPKRNSVTFTAEPNIPVSHDATVTETSANAPKLHYGVDVSQWQATINWATASKYLEFAIIRSQSGIDVLDSQWEANVNACIRYKIPYGVYVYGKAMTTNEAIAEARLCISRLNGRKPSLPIFYDVEDLKTNLTLSNAALYEVVEAFCTTIEKAGYRAGVYCSTNYWAKQLNDPRYAQWTRWVAQWSNACTYSKGFNLWQYACNGKNIGVVDYTGKQIDVDLNVWIGDLGDDSKMYKMKQSEPTCTASGKNVYTSLDGKINWTEKLAATGHSFANNKCIRCGASIPGTSAVAAFTDISTKAWYYTAVRYVVQRGLFTGMSKTEFWPNYGMTRGMLVTVLWRMAGSPKYTAYNPFVDVAAGKYYTMPIVWAYHKGYVSGMSKTGFSPDLNITREQLATMLYRYAGANQGSTAALNSFADASTVSDYARKPMAWAIQKGLIQGMPGNLLDPQGLATRAQVAQILMRYIKGS